MTQIGALVFQIAVDDVVTAVWHPTIFLTLQVTLNDVVRQRERTAVFEGLKVTFP